MNKNWRWSLLAICMCLLLGYFVLWQEQIPPYSKHLRLLLPYQKAVVQYYEMTASIPVAIDDLVQAGFIEDYEMITISNKTAGYVQLLLHGTDGEVLYTMSVGPFESITE
ncbi:MAG: hypothetical protein EOM12_12105 [Verrucomicrobiae bacterium]|nr:hypothetical protein [Verrucomicrobiae bacterium]